MLVNIVFSSSRAGDMLRQPMDLPLSPPSPHTLP